MTTYLPPIPSPDLAHATADELSAVLDEWWREEGRRAIADIMQGPTNRIESELASLRLDIRDHWKMFRHLRRDANELRS